MLSMRRELDVRHGRGQPLAQPPAAHHLASNLRNFDFELPALRRESAGYDSHDGISGAGGWRIFGADESWCDQRRCTAKARCVFALAGRSEVSMAFDHGDVSSRQLSAHWL